MKISLDALMGIRYLAAVTVVLVHADYLLFTTAVPFFFVLSGFILTYKYATPQGLAVDIRTFWLARFSRLYPCHLLALLLLVLWRISLHEDLTRTLGGLAASTFLVSAWCPSLVAGWNTPAWTNSCEAFFYLVFPLLVAASLQLRSRREMLLGMSAWYLAGLAAVSIALRGSSEMLWGTDWLGTFVKYSPLAHVPSFACGVLLGRLFADSRPSPNPRLGGCMSALALIAAVWLTLYVPSIPRLYVHNTLLVPVFAVLVWGLALGGGIAGPLSHPLLVRLGYASYAFYILQDPVGLPFYHALGQVETKTLSVVLSLIVLLTLVSVVVYEWFEVPVMQGLRRLAGDAQAPRPLRMAMRESLLGLGMSALLLGWALLLPQRPPHVPVTLDRTLAAVGATRVAWDPRTPRPFLSAYMAEAPHIAFVPMEQAAPYVFTGGAWPQAETLGARWLGAEPSGPTLWAMPGAFIPPYLDVAVGQRFGSVPHAAIRESGLYGVERMPDGTPFRWTGERAELDVPVPRPAPRHLLVRLGSARETDLTVTVDGTVVARRHVPGSAPTSLVLPLPPLRGHLRIGLSCRGFVPGGGDGRLLGVPLFGMELLP